MLLESNELTRRYGSKVALDRLTLSLPAGATVGLLGANGAGKTTALNLLTTLLEPSSGTATVGGHDIVSETLEVRRVVGYVPEHGVVYEGLTADEYLEMAGRIRGLDTATIRGRSERILTHFGLVEQRGVKLGTFSKGMRRKVLVTAALLHDPRVLFLDEPMDGLDVASQRKLGDLLRELASAGRLVVYSSHVLEQVERLCDTLVFIHEGRLAWSGPISELRASNGDAPLSEVFLRMTTTGGEGTSTWAELLGA